MGGLKTYHFKAVSLTFVLKVSLKIEVRVLGDWSEVFRKYTVKEIISKIVIYMEFGKWDLICIFLAIYIFLL